MDAELKEYLEENDAFYANKFRDIDDKLARTNELLADIINILKDFYSEFINNLRAE